MAANTNTATTLVSVGNREDLQDIIYRVAAEETPFMSNVGKSSAKAVTHEWQTEALAAPDATNASLEGNQNANTNGTPNLTSRMGNKTQIFTKVGEVSGTQEEVNKAGRSSELARQKLLKGIELTRDQEARFIGNYGSNDQSGGTPRRAAGALAWLTQNVARGSGGASGGYSAGAVTAATNGTTRAFTETLLKGVLATAFGNGGKPTQAYMGPTQKQEWSGMTGIAQIRKDAPAADKMASIVGAADVYVSDFGNLTAIPHPYGLTRDVLLIDPKYWAIATLRANNSEPLAKTGDSQEFQIIGEKTLECRNEKSSGVIADLS